MHSARAASFQNFKHLVWSTALPNKHAKAITRLQCCCIAASTMRPKHFALTHLVATMRQAGSLIRLRCPARPHHCLLIHRADPRSSPSAGDCRWPPDRAPGARESKTRAVTCRRAGVAPLLWSPRLCPRALLSPRRKRKGDGQPMDGVRRHECPPTISKRR
jgi:hypothetical protein